MDTLDKGMLHDDWRVGSKYSMDTLDKGTLHVLGRVSMMVQGEQFSKCSSSGDGVHPSHREGLNPKTQCFGELYQL